MCESWLLRGSELQCHAEQASAPSVSWEDTVRQGDRWASLACRGPGLLGLRPEEDWQALRTTCAPACPGCRSAAPGQGLGLTRLLISTQNFPHHFYLLILYIHLPGTLSSFKPNDHICYCINPAKDSQKVLDGSCGMMLLMKNHSR